MSLRGVRKVVTELNAALRICKVTGGLKPPKPTLDTSISEDILLFSKQLSSLSLCKSQTEKFCCPLPILDVAIKNPIIEPNKTKKINFELPIRNSNNSSLDLPLHIEKDIAEPGEVISKKAVHETVIRKRKMKKHKRKKFSRKYKTELSKRKLDRSLEKEDNFQNSLRLILNEKDNFSAENYVTDMLERAHWQKPCNKVRGRLAPAWVIREHLRKTEEERILKERIKECLK